jgi:hypothetical protein
LAATAQVRIAGMPVGLVASGGTSIETGCATPGGRGVKAIGV